MHALAKRVVQCAAATALALGGVAVSGGTANATVDSDCAYGTCLWGDNYYTSQGGQFATAHICNDQSSANDFVVWISGIDNTYVVAPTTTPMLSPGQCWIFGNSVPVGWGVQIYARSGSLWTYGTNPIAPSW